jgi:peptidoglycan/xylan/chitin deacetylase (PgdA/CDA1 family)
VKALATLASVAVLAGGFFAAYEWAEAPANQLFGATIVSGPPSRHAVALTFDDGPNPPYTNEILSILEREGVHATFFVVGQDVARFPRVVAREVRDGDAVGNHTWNHAHLDVMTPAAIAASLRRTGDAIVNAAGVRATLMRPPYGKRDWLVLSVVRSMGLRPVMWSVPLAHDWEGPPAQVIARRILSRVRDGSIIVLHDGDEGRICNGGCDRSSSVAATRLVVEALKRRGYALLTVPELLASPRSSQNSTKRSS